NSRVAYSFRPVKNVIREIKDFLDQRLAQSHPEKLDALKMSGRNQLLLGCLLLIASVAASAGSYFLAAHGVQGTYFVFYGLTLFGMGTIVSGTARLLRASRIGRKQRKWNEFVGLAPLEAAPPPVAERGASGEPN